MMTTKMRKMTIFQGFAGGPKMVVFRGSRKNVKFDGRNAIK